MEEISISERKENNKLFSSNYIPETHLSKFKKILEKERYMVNSEIRISLKYLKSKENKDYQYNYQGVFLAKEIMTFIIMKNFLFLAISIFK